MEAIWDSLWIWICRSRSQSRSHKEPSQCIDSGDAAMYPRGGKFWDPWSWPSVHNLECWCYSPYCGKSSLICLNALNNSLIRLYSLNTIQYWLHTKRMTLKFLIFGHGHSGIGRWNTSKILIFLYICNGMCRGYINLMGLVMCALSMNHTVLTASGLLSM